MKEGNEIVESTVVVIIITIIIVIKPSFDRVCGTISSMKMKQKMKGCPLVSSVAEAFSSVLGYYNHLCICNRAAGVALIFSLTLNMKLKSTCTVGDSPLIASDFVQKKRFER